MNKSRPYLNIYVDFSQYVFRNVLVPKVFWFVQNRTDYVTNWDPFLQLENNETNYKLQDKFYLKMINWTTKILLEQWTEKLMIVVMNLVSSLICQNLPYHSETGDKIRSFNFARRHSFFSWADWTLYLPTLHSVYVALSKVTKINTGSCTLYAEADLGLLQHPRWNALW